MGKEAWKKDYSQRKVIFLLLFIVVPPVRPLGVLLLPASGGGAGVVLRQPDVRGLPQDRGLQLCPLRNGRRTGATKRNLRPQSKHD